MGTTVTNRKYIHEEIKSRMKSGNACYHAVRKLLSSGLLPRNLNTKIYRPIILPVVYGHETWSLTMREERRLKVFENRVLRRIFGTKRDELTKEWTKLRNEELNDLYSSRNNVIKKNEMGGACSTFGGEEAYTGFWWGNVREREHVEDLRVYGTIVLRWIFWKWDVGAWTAMSLLRIGTSGGHL